MHLSLITHLACQLMSFLSQDHEEPNLAAAIHVATRRSIGSFPVPRIHSSTSLKGCAYCYILIQDFYLLREVRTLWHSNAKSGLRLPSGDAEENSDSLVV